MDVLQHPNPALKQVASPVDPTKEKDLRDLCKTMARLMYEAPGVGLAATQVGVLKRVIVYDIDEEKRGVIALCNPTAAEQALTNLVENAIAYGDAGGHVFCTLPPDGPDAATVAERARAAGVGLHPAEACGVRGGDVGLSRSLLVGFAALTPTEIKEAFGRLL